jgi:hypothetical protein
MRRVKQAAHDTLPYRSAPAPENTRALVFLIALGLLTRVALAACSWGTNDASTFYRLGEEVSRQGLLATYRQDPDLNHPPIPAFWAAAAYRLTRAHPKAFSFVLKLPSILADGEVAWLLWKILLPRVSSRRALLVAAFYAWCLDAILVSGYHCNTDPVYAFLCLVSVWLMADKRWYFGAGLALGAAVNVKLTPILLAGPLLLNCRTWKQAAGFVAGLSLGAIPFLPILLGPAGVRAAFGRNALAYNSYLDKWGIGFFLLPSAPNDMLPADYDSLHSAAAYYYFHGRFVVLALIGGWSVASRLLGRWGLYEVAAVTLAIFLIFAPGFGVQYTVMVLPLLFVIRPRLAMAYGLAAGIFLLAVYFITWTGEFPLFSNYHSLFPMPSPWFGLVAWATLVAFVVIALVRPSATKEILRNAQGP